MIIDSVAALVGIVLIHFVKYLFFSDIHLCLPLEFGFISSMKSNPLCLKGASTLIGLSGKGRMFYFPANIWYSEYALTNALISGNKVGQ